MINIRRRRDPLSAAVPMVPPVSTIRGPLRFVLAPQDFKIFDANGTDVSRLFPTESIKIEMTSDDLVPRVQLTLIGVDMRIEATIAEAQLAEG